MEKLITSLQHFDSPLWGYHLPVPTSVAQTFVEGKNRRVVCTLAGQYRMQCAIMQMEDIYFVLINKKMVDKMALQVGDDVEMSIEKDHSKFGHEVPESFQNLLDQDEEGRTFFENLTMGKQRSLIYLIGTVKSIDSQINKGLAILHHLRMTQGQLDFKQLNALIKEYNQRSRLK
jgi:hypothetical protein